MICLLTPSYLLEALLCLFTRQLAFAFFLGMLCTMFLQLAEGIEFILAQLAGVEAGAFGRGNRRNAGC